MEKNYDEQFIIMQAVIEANKWEMRSNKQDSGEKMTQFIVKFETILAVISSHINTLEHSPTQKDTSNPLDPTIVVTANRKAPPLDGGNSTKIGGMWTLKHEIRSPKFYELLTKTELKGDTAMDLRNLYNHIKMCLNTVTRLR